MACEAMVAAACLLAGAAGSAAPARHTVGMLGVTGGGGFSPALLGTVEEMLLSSLAGTRKFAVKTDFGRALGSERRDRLLACTDGKCLAEAAGTLGVSYLVSADLGRLGTRCVITVKIIDAARAEVAARVTRAVAEEGLLVDVMDEIARALVFELPEPVAPTPDDKDARTDQPSPDAATEPPAAPSGAPAEATAPSEPPASAAAAPAATPDAAAPDAATPEAAAAADLAAPAPAPPPPRRSPWGRPTPPAVRHRHFAARLGLSPLLGVAGAGVEARALRRVGVALGTGTHALAGGLSFFNTLDDGGFYLDVHVVWIRSYLVDMPASGAGAGLTVGWDWRFVPWLSVKTGVGVAASTLLQNLLPLPLAFDLAVGPVF